MPIWKLTPAHEYDATWQRSTYHGTTIIRAADEPAARQVASRTFGTAMPPGDTMLYDPWQYLATCGEVTDSGYPEDGPEAVLWPVETPGMVMPPAEHA
jgi:hypothetical protein